MCGLKQMWLQFYILIQAYTFESQTNFFFPDCFHKILHILYVNSLVLYLILLQVLNNFTIDYYVRIFYKFVNASSKIIFNLTYFKRNATQPK